MTKDDIATLLRLAHEGLEARMSEVEAGLEAEEFDAWSDEFRDALESAYDNLDHILAHLPEVKS